MKIAKKLRFTTREELVKHGAINIVVFGDSVTHGAGAKGVIDYESVYWNRLRKKLNALNPYPPVNIINSGIGATSADNSQHRFVSQALRYNPDLIIMCFGLNDVHGTLEMFDTALHNMFSMAKEHGADVIFLTPNMLNTYVADDLEGEEFIECAHRTARLQTDGTMDKFIDLAKSVCKEFDIPVCDCYAKWKELSKTEDITMLLANRINHPTPEMHELFAGELYKMIITDYDRVEYTNNSTVYLGEK